MRVAGSFTVATGRCGSLYILAFAVAAGLRLTTATAVAACANASYALGVSGTDAAAGSTVRLAGLRVDAGAAACLLSGGAATARACAVLATLPRRADVSARPAVGGVRADGLAGLPALDQGWLALLFLLFLFRVEVVGVLALVLATRIVMIALAPALVTAGFSPLLAGVRVVFGDEWQQQATKKAA